MAAGDSKGGSDLDVFEGLGKKSSTRAPASAPRTSAPPPPPSLRSAAPQPKPVPAQSATLPSAGASPVAAPSSRTPPPPPGRTTLPQVVPPPSKAAIAAAKPASAPAASAPAPAPAAAPNAGLKALSQPPPPNPAAGKAGGKGLEMDWDEDEEATHVLDRENSKEPSPSKPTPGAGRPAAAAAAPQKQTLLGLSSSSGAPGARPPSLPPPPPSASNPYARPPAPPGTNAAPPTPSTPPPATPPPSIRAAAAAAAPAAAASPTPSTPAPNGSASNFPYQATTTPLAMPPRTSARAQLNPKIEDAPVLPPRPNRMEATALVRPQQKSTGLFMLAGGAVLALIVTGLLLMPRSGQIAINVADTKGGAVKGLQISIDGVPKCESAPCLVKELVSGSHTVKVEATGYEIPAEKAVAIESGKLTGVDFTLTPVAPSGGTGIKVTGSQPGEKLIVDDREIGTLPQEIRDLAPGNHKVRVVAGERYGAVEKTITLGKDEFQDLGAVTLKVVKGRATVTLATPGAKVFLVSGSDKRELPTLPMSIDLDPSKQWSLVATKTGYNDFAQPLSFDDGQAEKSFTVTLDPKTASAVSAPVAYNPPSSPAPRPPPSEPPVRPSHSEPKEPKEPSGGGGGGGEGTLNMNSIPASSVVLDGKPIGTTPQIGITVSAGTHRVVFINADQGFKKEVSVSVAAGETKKVHP